MNYQLASASDFAADHFFIEWVNNPTSESSAFWQQWLQQHPQQYEVVQEARELVMLLSEDGHPEDQADVNEVWLRLQQSIQVEATEKAEALPYSFWQRRSLLVAASLGLLLLLSGAFLFSLLHMSRFEHATAFGERRTILLPDSSVVIMNANTSLAYKGWSGTEPRVVQLKGEAYFSVKHQQNNQKFVVQTPDGSEVEVLGTEFNVASRETGNRVVLASGKVRFHYNTENAAQQLTMQPGELVEVSGPANSTLTRKQVRPELYTAWKDNKVIFDNTSLQEIAEMLEQVYGYKVVIADAGLADQKLTASLDARGVDSILAVVSETLDATVTKKENTITIQLPNI